MATETSKEKRSKSHIGQKAWNKGRPASIEERLKTSQATKQGMTEEVRSKLSLSLKGKKNPEHSKRMRGRKLTEEHKQKIRDAYARHPENCTCWPHNLTNIRTSISKNQKLLSEMIQKMGFEIKTEEPFGRKKVDIYIPELHLAVEYDGAYWHQNKEEDDVRDLFLKEKFGLEVIHINSEEFPDIEGAEEQILRKLDAPRLKRLVQGRA